MKTENKDIFSQSDRSLRQRKYLTVLVGLVLIVSGLIVTSVAVGSVPTARGGRPGGPETDNSTNDWNPCS
jgi:hypothetical protein